MYIFIWNKYYPPHGILFIKLATKTSSKAFRLTSSIHMYHSEVVTRTHISDRKYLNVHPKPRAGRVSISGAISNNHTIPVAFYGYIRFWLSFYRYFYCLPDIRTRNARLIVIAAAAKPEWIFLATYAQRVGMRIIKLQFVSSQVVACDFFSKKLFIIRFEEAVQ